MIFAIDEKRNIYQANSSCKKVSGALLVPGKTEFKANRIIHKQIKWKGIWGWWGGEREWASFCYAEQYGLKINKAKSHKVSGIKRKIIGSNSNMPSQKVINHPDQKLIRHRRFKLQLSTLT